MARPKAPNFKLAHYQALRNDLADFSENVLGRYDNYKPRFGEDTALRSVIESPALWLSELCEHGKLTRSYRAGQNLWKAPLDDADIRKRLQKYRDAWGGWVNSEYGRRAYKPNVIARANEQAAREAAEKKRTARMSPAELERDEAYRKLPPGRSYQVNPETGLPEVQ